MICCGCWSCCLDLRAKVRLDDESIFSILFVVNKDADRRKQELSAEIQELKGLLQRPTITNNSVVNQDNRQVNNRIAISKTSRTASIAAADLTLKDGEIMSPFAEKFFQYSQSNTPRASKAPSFSVDFLASSSKRQNNNNNNHRQLAFSPPDGRSAALAIYERGQSFSATENTLVRNADAREFLIHQLLDQLKFEDALEKAVQLVDMRRSIFSKSVVGTSALIGDNPLEHQLNTALLLAARCWRAIKRQEYALRISDEALQRQKSAETSSIRFDGIVESLNLMAEMHEEVKQQAQAIGLYEDTVRYLKQRLGIDITDSTHSAADPPLGLATVIHAQAEYLASIDRIDEAIDAYLEEVGIYERLKIQIDWRTLYRLGQLIARRQAHLRAIFYFDLCIEIIVKLHGHNYLPLGDVYHSKALSQWQISELVPAIICLRKALVIKLNHYEMEGGDTNETALSIAMINHALGEITDEQGQPYDAIPYLEKAMEYYTLGHGTREHLSVAQTLHGLGDLLLQLQVKKEALSCFEQAFALYTLFRGKYHLQNMDVLTGKAAVLRLMGRYQEALYVLQVIHEVFSYEFGDDDARSEEVRVAIEAVKRDIESPPTPMTPTGGMTLATNSLDENFNFTSPVAAAIVSGADYTLPGADNIMQLNAFARSPSIGSPRYVRPPASSLSRSLVVTTQPGLLSDAVSVSADKKPPSPTPLHILSGSAAQLNNSNGHGSKDIFDD